MLAGICVVCINYYGSVFKIVCGIMFCKENKIFIMIVGLRFAVLVYISAQDSVRIFVALALNFPASVNENVRMLSCRYGIEHYRKVAACRVFHTYGNVKTACRKTVELIFNRSCAYCNV